MSAWDVISRSVMPTLPATEELLMPSAPSLAEVGTILSGFAALLWPIIGIVALLLLYRLIRRRDLTLSKFGVGPGGVSLEFAAAKLDEAVRETATQTTPVIGKAATQSVLNRLRRDADLLAGARVLWADDHPENNSAIVELLQRFGVTVETARSNDHALALLRSTRYDLVITDVARDTEGSLAGIDLAEAVQRITNQKAIVFTGAFNPATMLRATAEERLVEVQRVQQSVFAITNRIDEVLHYVLDVLERG